MSTTSYQSSEREEAARKRLYESVRELRESLLDLLSLVSASGDPTCATADIARSEIDRLRLRAREIEHADYKIKRARAVIDGTKDADKLTGPLNARASS